MSLAAQLTQGPPPLRKGPGCTVGTLLRSLPPDEGAALAVMLDDQNWTAEAVGRLITAEVGVKVQGGTVARHRRGACGCEPR